MDPTGFDEEEMKALMTQISKARMPFGKYGPAHYPPNGVPLFDLPPEYLYWFKNKGYPKGKLGRLMAIIYEAKINGCDHVFDPFRQSNGGRTKLHGRKRQKSFTFEDDDEDSD